jgi:hypothetical protein
MSKMSNEDKCFSEDIERLLDGKEIKADESLSKDYRSTLEFANKLLSKRAKPSVKFKHQLKERLLLKLRQQEAESAREKEEGNWFWEGLRNLFSQSPAWRTAMVTVTIAVVAIVVVWRMGAFSEAPEIVTTLPPDLPTVGVPPPSAIIPEQTMLEIKTKQEGDIDISLRTEISIDISFRNTGNELITLSSFPPPMYIVQESSLRPVHFWEAGDQKQGIPPSEKINHTAIWDQKESDGTQVVPGMYTVYIGEIIFFRESETQAIQPVFPPLVRINIQSP